ncbi:MAG: hypothetical protein CMJ39_00400 [Phycisphaerae bacterium]|nr:hypothetical protein [Phycisphaerae bacterium]
MALVVLPALVVIVPRLVEMVGGTLAATKDLLATELVEWELAVMSIDEAARAEVVTTRMPITTAVVVVAQPRPLME